MDKLDREDRALLVDLKVAKQELVAARERYSRLRLACFRRGLSVAVIARMSGERYDAVRMARKRARV